MIRGLLFWPFAAVSTLFFSVVSVFGGALGAPKGLYDWVHRSWSRSLLAVAGIRVRTEGLEHVRPGSACIVAANHQSMFDIWTLMAALPLSLRFVAKRELGRIPVFAGACRAAGHAFIDRQDRGAAIRAIRRAGERMRREGLALVFFPEGTRARDGRLQPFKRGTFVLAIETQTPLLPVAIEGTHAVLPAGARAPRPGTITVRCGPLLSLEGRTVEDRDEVLRATRGAIAGMLEELRRRAGPRERGAAGEPGVRRETLPAGSGTEPVP